MFTWSCLLANLLQYNQKNKKQLLSITWPNMWAKIIITLDSAFVCLYTDVGLFIVGFMS